jgi:hypothetical protein
VSAWPVRELNGNIYVWRHDGGEPPSYELTPIAQWSDPDWTDSFRKYRWRVRTHPQEVAENTIDYEHFKALHGMASVDLRIFEADGVVMHWGVGSKGEGSLPAAMPERFKPAEEGFSFSIWGQAWGVGVAPAFISNSLFEVMELAHMTPVDDEITEINIGFLLPKRALENTQVRPLVERYLEGHVGALDQDIPIWENKLYRDKPVLSTADGPIREFRAWAEQFYSRAA